MCNAGSCPNKSRTSVSWLQMNHRFRLSPSDGNVWRATHFCLGHCAPIQPCTCLFINLLIGNRRSNRRFATIYSNFDKSFTQNLQNFKETTLLPSISNQSQPLPTILPPRYHNHAIFTRLAFLSVQSVASGWKLPTSEWFLGWPMAPIHGPLVSWRMYKGFLHLIY